MQLYNGTSRFDTFDRPTTPGSMPSGCQCADGVRVREGEARFTCSNTGLEFYQVHEPTCAMKKISPVMPLGNQGKNGPYQPYLVIFFKRMYGPYDNPCFDTLANMQS